MTKQQARRALINIEYEVVKPWVHAGALASGCAAFAIPSGAPALSWACIGAGFSFFWYWGTNNLTRPKRKKNTTVASVGAGSVVVNSVEGSRKVRLGGGFEYSQYQPAHINRETWPETLRRWARGQPEPRRVIDKLHVPREFVFLSHYDGKPVEIREDDLRRFLRAAWKLRQRGVGLSHRHWVKKWRQRPQWYKDLGPYWYRAVLVLLHEAELARKCQLVVCIGPQWYALARDPHITLGILREAEVMKGNVRPDAPVIDTPVLVIGTDGASSFEG